MRFLWLVAISPFVVIVTTRAQVNSWANPSNAGGNWGTPANWASGFAPSIADSAEFITNTTAGVPHTKTVIIDSTTSSATLTISNLTISAPSLNRNDLNLFNTGSFTAFEVRNLNVAKNGAIFITNSWLRVLTALNMDGITVALNTGTIETWFPGSGPIPIPSSALAVIGNTGTGVVQVTEGRWQCGPLRVGTFPSGQGTLYISGGSITMFQSIDNFFLPGLEVVNGAVWMTGGQVTSTKSMAIGSGGGIGQMTVSNGTLIAESMNVGVPSGSLGTLAAAGGTSSVYSAMVLGDFPCVSTGIVNIVGGELDVTNGLASAVLEVRSGTLTLSGGTLRADSLVITNACAHFVRTGGTLIVSNIVLDANSDADGDGVSNGYEQSHGLDPLNPADGNLDRDGDGLSNLQEYLAGTDATNSASAFRITSISPIATNLLVTWTMGSGKTNALQRTGGAVNGSYSTNNFTTIFTVTNTVGTTTNYLDIGGATNSPARYYRVRLVP